MLAFSYLFCWLVLTFDKSKINFWGSSAPKKYDFWEDVVGPLLWCLIYALFVFLVLFAIQYLCCLLFKRKWSQNLFSIILIVEEAIVAVLVLGLLIRALYEAPPSGGAWLSIMFFASPFACAAGASFARRLHRWVIKRKEKKAQALNPAS